MAKPPQTPEEAAARLLKSMREKTEGRERLAVDVAPRPIGEVVLHLLASRDSVSRADIIAALERDDLRHGDLITEGALKVMRALPPP